MTPALLACIAAYLAAFVLAFIQVRLSVIPLALFLLACFVAPFFPGYGFYLPVISRGSSGSRAVALTFDDGPDQATTPALMELLKRHEATATFFIIGERAAAHPGLVKLILSGGHSIGNHSYHHSPLLMLRSLSRLRAEIQTTQELLSEFGVSAHAFRPPVGITSPRLGPVLAEAGLVCVNFSRRGFDAGNRRLSRLSEKILKRVKPDDIILMHDRSPKGSTGAVSFISEVEHILSGLKEKNMHVLPLSELTGMTIMERN
jgi:peptidoglycan/xylan/chitin deacetylase (PgdA/CDA1 family)